MSMPPGTAEIHPVPPDAENRQFIGNYLPPFGTPVSPTGQNFRFEILGNFV